MIEDRDKAQEALDKILHEDGWKFLRSEKVAPAVIEYQIQRRRDGRVASFRTTIKDLVLTPAPEGVTLSLALALLQLARSENLKAPLG